MHPAQSPISVARLLALLSAGVLLLTCKSQVDLLPSATQSGQNTFGCLIDGKSYVPDGGPGFMASKPIYGGFLVISIRGGLGIYIHTHAKDNQRIGLYLSDYILGKHLLNKDTGTIPASLDPEDYGQYENNSDTYVTSSTYTGFINLTKADTLSGVVSGTFEFTVSTKNGKTVSITNGRFDVNARTQ